MKHEGSFGMTSYSDLHRSNNVRDPVSSAPLSVPPRAKSAARPPAGRRYPRLLPFLFLSLAVGLAACGSDDGGSTSSMDRGLLLVQNAASASFTAEGPGGTLVLEGIAPRVLFFTDRPGRRVGTLDFATVLDELFGADSSTELPNAALSWSDGDTERTAIVMLEAADYDPGTATVVYQVRPLVEDERTRFDVEDSGLPTDRVGPVSLFVDPVDEECDYDPYPGCV